MTLLAERYKYFEMKLFLLRRGFTKLSIGDILYYPYSTVGSVYLATLTFGCFICSMFIQVLELCLAVDVHLPWWEKKEKRPFRKYRLRCPAHRTECTQY